MEIILSKGALLTVGRIVKAVEPPGNRRAYESLPRAYVGAYAALRAGRPGNVRAGDVHH